MFSRLRATLAALGLAVGLAFGSAPAALAQEKQEKAVTIFAAASMKNALDDINAASTRSLKRNEE